MASNIITLNVGGTIYTTSIETLTRYPDSMLGAMFRTQHGNSESQLDPSNKDEHGRFFIDRDGPMFRYVLNFLRESSLTLPEDFKELDLLRREAEFYQIEPLIESVDKVVDNVAAKAVDTIEPKPSSRMEWVKVVYSRADYSWTISGKQKFLDQIKDQNTRYSYTDRARELRFVPLDNVINVNLFDVVLETVLRKNAKQVPDVPEDIEFPLYNLGFVRFCVTSYGYSEHLIFVHRTYLDE